MKQNEIAPHLFRTEYSKIVAVLCNTFQLKHVEIAEDIASETFLKAFETWGIYGIPANPTAWLYTTAKNKAKDYLKHNTVFETRVKKNLPVNEVEIEPDFEFSDKNISDSQLAMIFATCNPVNPIESQICLVLQILCGFSVEEIANAFLTKTETIKKRLQRARTNLRNGFKIGTLTEAEIASRLDAVLKMLYLLFNEGYYSKTNSRLIREDLCLEAAVLTRILTENSLTNTPRTNALLALMCFQSSRLNARLNDKNEAIVFDQQDRSLWDQTLIVQGNYYLVNACSGNQVSKYHLEAAVAYWHTTSTPNTKWQHILQLYNELILIEYSPVTALNRMFAFAKVYGHRAAISEAEKLNLSESTHYHGLLGYLYADSVTEKAISHYEQAIRLSKSKMEKQALAAELKRLKQNRPLTKESEMPNVYASYTPFNDYEIL